MPKYRHGQISEQKTLFLGTFPIIGTDEACVYLGTREKIGTFLDIGTDAESVFLDLYTSTADNFTDLNPLEHGPNK